MVGAGLSCRGTGRLPSRPLLPNWQRAQVGGNHLSGDDKARSGHSATRAPSESVRCPASELLPPSGIRHIPLMTGVVPQEAHLLLLPSAYVLAWQEPRAGNVAANQRTVGVCQ